MDPFKYFSFALTPCVSESSIKELKKLWSQKTRHYHNTNHLIQILQDIEKNIWFKELYPFEKRILILAAFFHDAIYDPKKKDNEDKSIEFFKKSWKHDDEIIFKTVIELIETTKHRKRPINKLSRIFWDADNSGFKKGYPELLKNEKLIRKEFSFVAKDKYKKARIDFLKTNLGLFDKLTDNDINKLIMFVEKN